ncbi:sugar-binding transcriptional regulator [Neogemmobacter tilapiae]|uniref:Transcriptional regulator n=1 Tax=Neogemmobacter tilapiae TaxID=875041 RepID=A0A918TIQ6_9RHOB|nr:sugar-binding domain-containing protein [Gemmobacter tilapiae]GHC50985.1 transcriptional regulator [Gemmobacter tilapiae]
MNTGATDESEAFLAEVCWHYYVNELTQSDVARVMGVTRLRVNKALQEARAVGLVRVEIRSPFVARLDVQERLRKVLGLAEVICAPADAAHHDYHGPVGAALALWLEKGLRDGQWKSIGMSWGQTLKSAIQRLPRLPMPDVDIVSMIGGTSQGGSFNAFGIASSLADKLGASYSLFSAPIYLSPGTDKAQFLSEGAFQSHLARLKRLDLAVLVAGDVTEKSFLVSMGLPNGVTPADLLAKGAVGDVLGHFLTVEGAEIAHPINSSVVGLDLEALALVPQRVLAAGGQHKVEIILAACRRGLVQTLITDDVTAEMLLGRLE